MKPFYCLAFIVLTINLFAQNPPKYEFRAVWVATVNNIDWPSKPGLTVSEQKEEAIAILDLNEKNRMNAVIFQVRPTSDSFYKSELEPWSRYLTGTPGKAPEPFYDPMQFWIEECHKRCMEFHAWLNPFRVSQNTKDALAGNHIAFKHPEWIVEYGDKLYFDPGLPQTREFVNQVVIDIVARYDVDAIHFDDYFYPYPLKEDFPDDQSFIKYNRGFSANQKADWRRDNVDMIIRMLSASIKKTKPWVKFGISPFGVWRNQSDDPEGSPTKAGTTNYDHLYADILKWQKNGWIDYNLPQLYWQIGHPSVDFKILANWWAEHTYERATYIGHALYKIDANSTTPEWKDPKQMPAQIDLIRKIPELSGSAFYSSVHFKRNLLGLDKSLQEKLYQYPAIVPIMPWIDQQAPEMPDGFKKRGKKIKLKHENNEQEVAASIRN